MGYIFTRDALLMVVADGMGGHALGEVAAQIALQSIGALFQMYAKPSIANPLNFLDEALRRGHRDILRYQTDKKMPESPRTTIVVALIQNGQAWWAHAGDSRLYWVRAGKVLDRTRDHSKVEAMVALGLLTEQQTEDHPERNKVFNCLGSPFEPTLEVSAGVTLQPGDSLMLCSDGVWGAFKESDIAQMFLNRPIAQTVIDLVRTAVDKQGRFADNATAVAVTWEGVSDRAQQTTEHVPDGAVSTTIPTWAIDEAMQQPDVTEDEIEKAVREIQLAISKT